MPRRAPRKKPNLFKDSPAPLQALHKEASKGLRLKARARWWAVKQAQDQAIQQDQRPDYNEE